MPTGVPQPERISYSIRNNLAFGIAAQDHELDLRRAKVQLEKIIQSGNCEAIDYAALGIVYFNLGKYLEFSSTLEEGIRRFQDLMLVKDYCTGKLSAFEMGIIDVSLRSVIEFWFNHSLNINQLELDYLLLIEDIDYYHHYDLRSPLKIHSTVNNKFEIHMQIGSNSIIEHLTDFEKIDCDFEYLILTEIVRSIQMNSDLASENKTLLNEVMSERDYAEFMNFVEPKSYPSGFDPISSGYFSIK